MRKLLVIAICVFVTLASAQVRDQVATTEDGKKVLLKADGTWEFLETKPTTKWREVKRWVGSGLKNTEPFTITAEDWRISWATKGGKYNIFQVMVYKGDSDLPDIAANVMGNNDDISYMKGAGEYRLVINATGDWEVVIEEKRKEEK